MYFFFLILFSNSHLLNSLLTPPDRRCLWKSFYSPLCPPMPWISSNACWCSTQTRDSLPSRPLNTPTWPGNRCWCEEFVPPLAFFVGRQWLPSSYIAIIYYSIYYDHKSKDCSPEYIMLTVKLLTVKLVKYWQQFRQ